LAPADLLKIWETMTRTVAIYIFDQVEVLDFAGPFEVFSTASRVYQRSHRQDELPFSVKLVAAKDKPVRARGGVRVVPDLNYSNCPPVDVLIVPGGVIDEELARDDISLWVRSRGQSAEITASVCTGAFILAKAGLLDNLSATTHWEDIDEFSEMFPKIRVIRNKRWVNEGRIITSAGISAGIDMSLHIVRRLEGEQLAWLTARQMDYRWQDDP
jgi:transcriptional regulator GlxA family with amidase domain